jgi:hypothetical protein
MKSFSTIYRNGHFYDEKTEKRIIPINGKHYVIASDDDAFQQEDELMPDNNPVLNEQKLKFLKQKYDANIIKLLHKESLLYFRLGLGTPGKSQKSLQYVFECKTNDDLYIYLPPGAAKTDPKNWRLLDCSCQLTKSILGGLTLTEKVTAKSLNQLFQHTVMFYFSMQRSGSCNPFSTYFKLLDNQNISDITIESIYAKKYTFLDQLRIQAVRKTLPANSGH